jgi:hypothetical protein
MKCPVCGDPITPEDKYCGACGNPTAEEKTAQPRDRSDAAVEPPPPRVPPSAAAAAHLTLWRGGARTAETFALGERATVGRFDAETGPVDVDLGPLPEAAYVSRRHAELRRDGAGQWFVKDLNSNNGTFVRSVRTETPGFQRVTDERRITDGDEIAFGNARFVFQVVPGY